jgi:hypothetical protein
MTEVLNRPEVIPTAQQAYRDFMDLAFDRPDLAAAAFAPILPSDAEDTDVAIARTKLETLLDAGADEILKPSRTERTALEADFRYTTAREIWQVLNWASRPEADAEAKAHRNMRREAARFLILRRLP